MDHFVVDAPEFTVEEDEYHNLILVFQQVVEKHPGDKIYVWSSKIAEEAKKELAIAINKKLKEKPTWTQDEVIHTIAELIVMG